MAASDKNREKPAAADSVIKDSERTPSGDPAKKQKQSIAKEGSVNMEFVLDIPLEITVELGRTKMLINDMLKLGQGSVIELTKLAGESLEILANQKPIARGCGLTEAAEKITYPFIPSWISIQAEARRRLALPLASGQNNHAMAKP